MVNIGELMRPVMIMFLFTRQVGGGLLGSLSLSSLPSIFGCCSLGLPPRTREHCRTNEIGACQNTEISNPLRGVVSRSCFIASPASTRAETSLGRVAINKITDITLRLNLFVF